MDIQITINCDNAAFEECPGEEISRILRELIEEIEFCSLRDHVLMDINGNQVGLFKVKMGV